MNFFENKIEYLKGVGAKKAAVLNKDLDIFTFGEMLQYYPFRHEDRSRFYTIDEIREDFPYVQLKGVISSVCIVGEGKKKRLVAKFQDETASIELLWFNSTQWITKQLQPNNTYIVFGKPVRYGSQYSITHPEFEPYKPELVQGIGLQPVYHTTDRMKKSYLTSKALAKIQFDLLAQAYEKIPESLPYYIIAKYAFLSKKEAVASVHFPKQAAILAKAKARLKFEELFYIQLKMLKQKKNRTVKVQGQIFAHIPTLKFFYKEHLPFQLTSAQKHAIREIYQDMKSGYQMNRLLQGDVGSGKTVTAFICMLIAIDNGTQACMMAPTEILAEQHYNTLQSFAQKLKIPIARLTGSTRKKQKQHINEALQSGELKIIVGTHALIEDTVDFHNLGLCVIDEQHRFGVAQRAKLWNKNAVYSPHVLVMTATPIPRTLAMTLYGDLDISVIDELPAGRKPIRTTHYDDTNRLKIWGFIRQQVKQGRQVYIVYPLIEESENFDYKNLEDGYEAVRRAFPEYPVSILHGRMHSEDKDYEMQRFAAGETKIMVATTVIEVGVNVPNATVMIIENAERFGLAQLHQLRGRVGRSTYQSYCLLMSENRFKLGKEAKIRLQTMCNSNDGFEIANVDLKLRGPGDLSGTQQSGVLDLQFANLGKDTKTLEEARKVAEQILTEDPTLEKPEHNILKTRLESFEKRTSTWSRIS